MYDSSLHPQFHSSGPSKVRQSPVNQRTLVLYDEAKCLRSINIIKALFHSTLACCIRPMHTKAKSAQ